MNNFRMTWFLGVLLFCGGPFSSAHADRVDDLLGVLKSNKSYKVRVTAVLGLSKYVDPRASIGLTRALANRAEHPYVRGFAALSLGRMVAIRAIPALKKAARSRNRFLRKKARQAMKLLCPRRVRRKRFYLNLEKSKRSGPMSELASELLVLKLAQYYAKRDDVILNFPKCRRPRKYQLRRLKGYFLNLKTKVRDLGGTTQCEIGIIVAAYPYNSLKAFYSADAKGSASPSLYVINLLVNALLQSHTQSIDQFLNARR